MVRTSEARTFFRTFLFSILPGTQYVAFARMNTITNTQHSGVEARTFFRTFLFSILPGTQYSCEPVCCICSHEYYHQYATLQSIYFQALPTAYCQAHLSPLPGRVHIFVKQTWPIFPRAGDTQQRLVDVRQRTDDCPRTGIIRMHPLPLKALRQFRQR